MEPEFLMQLNEIGANFVLLGMPMGTEFGIDMNFWKVGEKFKGVKIIPPGIHFIYFSSVSKDGDVAPRTGFFHNFGQKELLVYNYDHTTEDIFIETNGDQLERISSNLQNLEHDMGPYPLDSWSKWISLTQHMKQDDIKKMQPLSGKICSASELISQLPTKNNEVEDTSNLDSTQNNDRLATLPISSQVPDMRPKPGTELRFTKFPDKPYHSGATPQEITRGHMDSSYSLEHIFSQLNSPEDILAELQFSFCCFLVGQVWEGWEHWRLLIINLSKGEKCLIENPKLYMQLITCLHFQIEEVPADLFADIVERKNFLAASLTTFFANVRDNSSILPTELVSKTNKFKAHLISKFKWNLTLEDDDEDAPVVIELNS